MREQSGGTTRRAGIKTLIALALGALVSGRAVAAIYTNAASGTWSADASWAGGAKPPAGGAADAAVVFAGSGPVASSNDLAGTFLLNQMTFASGSTALSGNTLAFTNNGATGPQVVNVSGSAATISNSVVLGSDTTFAASNSITAKALFSGKGGLIKTGAYTLTLSTNNHTYVGSTIVAAGSLVIQTPNTGTATISSTNFTVQSGATLQILNGANPYWNAPAISVFTVQTNASLLIEANALYCGYLNAASGATVTGAPQLNGIDNAGRITASLGSLSFARIILNPVGSANPTQTLRFDGTGGGLVIGTSTNTPFSWRPGSASGLSTVRMDIGDSPSAPVDLLVPWLNLRPGGTGTAFFKQGSGVMRLDGLDWSSAASPVKPTSCTVSGGTFILNTSAANAAGVNFASLAIDSGATFQVGAGGAAGALYIGVTDDGTLAFSRADAYTFTNAITGAGGVVQKGPGALTLTGPNAYSGTTAVSGGTLFVNAPGALSGSGTVSVAAGAALGGSGTLAGPVAAAAGATLLPGGSNTVGTLTLSNAGADALTLNGCALLADLSNIAGACDRLAVAGGLVLNGANTIALAFPSGVPPAGTYTLMTYASRSGDGTLALNAYYPNATLAVTESSVTLTVTGPGITYLKWKGGASGIWDTSTANWQLNGADATYAEGDSVLFDDTAAANFTVGAAGAVTPASVTFNAATNYTLSASVAGASTPVIKMGAGTATLSGANTYGGGTFLTAGTLTVSSSANLPSAGPLTFGGGTLQILGTSFNSLAAYTVNWDSFRGGLDIAANNTITVTNAIGGSGSLTKSGGGTVSLTGANTYSGGTAVNAGYVRAFNASSLGTGPVNMTLDRSQLDLMGGLTVTNAITVRGAGFVNSAGSLQSYYYTTNAWNGPVLLGDGNARLGCPGGLLTIGGVISSGANVYDLIVRNPNDSGGVLVLASTNAYRGNTWIRCGTLRLGVNNALPPASLLQLGLDAGQSNVTNATFDLAGFDQQLAGLVDRGTDNAHAIINSAAAASTLTIANPSAAYTYGSTLDGNLSLVKVGGGALTLTGANTASGSVAVNAGTLAIAGAGTLGPNCTNIAVNAGTLLLSNSVALADSALLRIANGGGAKVNLAAGVAETVGWLSFGDKLRPGGVYSAATDSEHFAGTGVLIVRHGNGGTLLTVR
jgi:autotransporter-associated beta strand protein